MSTAANSNSTGQPTADSKAALPDGVGVIQTSEGPGTCSARTLRPRGRPTLDLGKLKGNAKLRGRARQRYERERERKRASTCSSAQSGSDSCDTVTPGPKKTPHGCGPVLGRYNGHSIWSLVAW